MKGRAEEVGVTRARESKGKRAKDEGERRSDTKETKQKPQTQRHTLTPICHG